MPLDAADRSAIRIAQLEEQIRLLSAGLGLDGPLPSIPSEVMGYAEAGADVKAVDALRRAAPGRLSLRSAKGIVGAIHAR